MSEDFCIIYEEIYDTRKQAKKQCKVDPKDQNAIAINSGLKLSLNSLYGKSNSQYSVVYDPSYTAATCINGQLSLSMLAESLSEFSEVFYVNTDGLTIRIHKDQVERMYDVCKQWETLTQLELESVQFKSMFIRDCNNIIAVDEYGNIKLKGAYEIDKAVGKEPAVWKNNSYRIIPLAVKEYFINNVSIEDTIYNHDNIYDFCALGKAKKGWSIFHGDVKKPNINRYFVSNNEALPTLIKVNDEDGRIISLEAHPDKKNQIYHLEEFNKYVPKNNYEINYDYYINECIKLINTIENE